MTKDSCYYHTNLSYCRTKENNHYCRNRKHKKKPKNFSYPLFSFATLNLQSVLFIVKPDGFFSYLTRYNSYSNYSHNWSFHFKYVSFLLKSLWGHPLFSFAFLYLFEKQKNHEIFKPPIMYTRVLNCMPLTSFLYFCHT